MNRIHHWLCSSETWRKNLERELLPWVLDGVSLGGDVLEVGPGTGLTTEILRIRCERLTALEIDPKLARQANKRMRGTNATIIRGDATAMPFGSGSFSGAVSLTMLHHVPSQALQDGLLREVLRVLKPGGQFAGEDSVWTPRMWLLHIGDTLNAINPETFAHRLRAAGFADPRIEAAGRAFRFSARRPEEP
ncbi:MAG: class I SAM-dependent methyltransferase [Terriglobia bacterium]